jgi:hypothetical protein
MRELLDLDRHPRHDDSPGVTFSRDEQLGFSGRETALP